MMSSSSPKKRLMLSKPTRPPVGTVPKRGRGTSKTKVIVAVSLNKEGHPQYATMRVVENFKAKTVEQFMYDNVKMTSVITTDGFSSYRSQKLTKDYFHDFENFNKDDEDSNVKLLHILIRNAKGFYLGLFMGSTALICSHT
jgi:transposase-like protein